MATPEQMVEAEEIARACNDAAKATYEACFQGDSTDLRGVARVMLARSAQSLAAANLTAQHGFPGGRTAIEIAIDFAYIATNPGPLIARFQAYAHVFEYKLASAVNDHGGEVPADVLADLERRRDEFRDNNPGTTGNWAGRKLSDRAQDADRVVLYKLAYADQCNASHSGPGTLEYTLVRSDAGLAVRFGAAAPQAHPIMLAVAGLNVLISDAVEKCGLDPALDAPTEEISKRLRGLAGADPRFPH
jgi:hypothetical protein